MPNVASGLTASSEIFMWMLDVCMANAWTLGRSVGIKMDQLGFRRVVVQTLLLQYGTPLERPGQQ